MGNNDFLENQLVYFFTTLIIKNKIETIVFLRTNPLTGGINSIEEGVPIDNYLQRRGTAIINRYPLF